MLQIIVPMAGKGKRLQDAGYEKPKPLIEISGIPLFIRSLNFIRYLKNEISIHLIINEKQLNVTEIESKLNDFQINAAIHTINDFTKGAAETVYSIVNYIPKELPCLIVDCDIEFYSEDFFKFINEFELKNRLEGALTYFESNENKYSYIQVDKNNKVIGIQEKAVISNKAVIGAYFFGDIELFKSSYLKIRGQEINKNDEYYISKVINNLILDGYTFRCFRGIFSNYGSPEDIKKYI